MDPTLSGTSFAPTSKSSYFRNVDTTMIWR